MSPDEPKPDTPDSQTADSQLGAEPGQQTAGTPSDTHASIAGPTSDTPTAQAVSGALQSPARAGRRRLSPRGRRVVRAILANPDGSQADWGRAAGIGVGPLSRHPTQQIAGQVRDVLSQPAVQATLREIIASRPDLSNTAIADRLGQGLNSRVVYEGKQTQIPDMGMRHRYVETVLRVTGQLQPDSGEISIGVQLVQAAQARGVSPPPKGGGEKHPPDA